MKPLSPKQAKVLAALLSAPSIVEAGKLCGMSERSVFRYLKDPAFIDLYRQARSEQVRQAVCQIQRIAAKAATVLEQVMDNEHARPSARILACKVVLQTALYGVQLEDLEVRLSLLEHAQEDHGSDS